MSVKSTSRSARRAARKAGRAVAEVPGPSTNPATNLLILDVVMRGASLIAGRLIEKGTLRTRYTAEKAADIVKGRSMAQTLIATGAARIATRSVPGLLLVAGGLFAKAAFDRSQSRRKARREGDRALAEQAERADGGE